MDCITIWFPCRDATPAAAKPALAFKSLTICPLDVAMLLVMATVTAVADPSNLKVNEWLVVVSSVALVSVPTVVAFCAKLPSSAFATLSPASTWKADVEDVNASCCLPVASVFTEAVICAFCKAVACCVPPAAALVMAALTAETRPAVPPRFCVLTEILIPLPSKPGPFT